MPHGAKYGADKMVDHIYKGDSLKLDQLIGGRSHLQDLVEHSKDASGNIHAAQHIHHHPSSGHHPWQGKAPDIDSTVHEVTAPAETTYPADHYAPNENKLTDLLSGRDPWATGPSVPGTGSADALRGGVEEGVRHAQHIVSPEVHATTVFRAFNHDVSIFDKHRFLGFGHQPGIRTPEWFAVKHARAADLVRAVRSDPRSLPPGLRRIGPVKLNRLVDLLISKREESGIQFAGQTVERYLFVSEDVIAQTQEGATP
jgi:hypothetical protein